jgi:hypothetical protein
MEKEFVPYAEALAFKELGFNELCFGYYDLNHNLQFMYNGKPEKFTERRMGVSDSKWVGWISTPLYQQAFRWFREKYNLHCFIQCPEEPIGKEIHTYTKWCFSVFEINKQELFFSNEEYKTYEEAELECLKKLIEIVKNK